MNDQTQVQIGKAFKSGKAEVTIFFSENGPTLQECMVNILCSHMTKKPKF